MKKIARELVDHLSFEEDYFGSSRFYEGTY